MAVIQYFHVLEKVLQEAIVNISKEPFDDFDRYKPKYRKNKSANCQPCTKPHQSQDGPLLLIPGERPKPECTAPDQTSGCNAKNPLGIKDHLPAPVNSAIDPASCCSSTIVGHWKAIPSVENKYDALLF
jgi:hypothetical protein